MSYRLPIPLLLVAMASISGVRRLLCWLLWFLLSESSGSPIGFFSCYLHLPEGNAIDCDVGEQEEDDDGVCDHSFPSFRAILSFRDSL